MRRYAERTVTSSRSFANRGLVERGSQNSHGLTWDETCNGLCGDEADAVQGLGNGIADGDVNWKPPNATQIQAMSRSDALAAIVFDADDASLAPACSLQAVLFSDLARSNLPAARVLQLEDPHISTRSLAAVQSVLIKRLPSCAAASLAASSSIVEVLHLLRAQGVATLVDGRRVNITQLAHGVLWSDEPLRTILSVTVSKHCSVAPVPDVVHHLMRSLRSSVDDSALLWVPRVGSPSTLNTDHNPAIAAVMRSSLFSKDLRASKLLEPGLNVEGWTVATNWKRGSFNDTVKYAVCPGVPDFDPFASTAPVVVPSATGMQLTEMLANGNKATYSVGPALAAAGTWFPAVAGNPPRTVTVDGLGCYEAWANGSLYMEQGNFDASGAYVGGCPACGNRSAAAAAAGRCNEAGGLSCDASGFNYRCVAQRVQGNATNSFVGVWEGYCEQFSGTHGSMIKCSADGCRQTYRISYDANQTFYESGALFSTCHILGPEFAYLADSLAFPDSLPRSLLPVQSHSVNTWAAGYAWLAADMLMQRSSVDLLLRSPLLALSAPCDVYVLGQRLSVKDASDVVVLPCSWQTRCYSQTVRLMGYAPFNVGCSGRALEAATTNQSSITVTIEFSRCLAKWFEMCAHFSNVSSFCVAPVMIRAPSSSRWFQEIVAVNGTRVTLKAPGSLFDLPPDSYLSSSLPSISQTKSFGMFDSVAAPAVYPVFSLKKAAQQAPYSPHDTSVLYDSSHNYLSFDSGSSAPALLSDISYATVLSVSRSSRDSSSRNVSATCPTVVIATPTPIASSFVTVRPERAPSTPHCLLRTLDDGSTTSNWLSEVQLSNHLSMPFMVSAV